MRQQENRLMKKELAPSLERSPKQVSQERGKKKLMEQSFADATPMNRSFVEQSSFISIVDNTSQSSNQNPYLNPRKVFSKRTGWDLEYNPKILLIIICHKLKMTSARVRMSVSSLLCPLLYQLSLKILCTQLKLIIIFLRNLETLIKKVFLKLLKEENKAHFYYLHIF